MQGEKILSWQHGGFYLHWLPMELAAVSDAGVMGPHA